MPSIVQVAPTGGVLPCLCDHGPVCWILEGGGENEDLDWRGSLPFPLWQPQTNHRDEKEAVATSVGWPTFNPKWICNSQSHHSTGRPIIILNQNTVLGMHKNWDITWTSSICILRN